MGKIRQHVLPEHKTVRSLLLIETIARVIKNAIKSRLRQKMKQTRFVGEEPYKSVGKKKFSKKVLS